MFCELQHIKSGCLVTHTHTHTHTFSNYCLGSLCLNTIGYAHDFCWHHTLCCHNTTPSVVMASTLVILALVKLHCAPTLKKSSLEVSKYWLTSTVMEWWGYSFTNKSNTLFFWEYVYKTCQDHNSPQNQKKKYIVCIRKIKLVFRIVTFTPSRPQIFITVIQIPE